MESYQILGIIGSALLIVGVVLFFYLSSVYMSYPMYARMPLHMGYPMMYTGYPILIYSPFMLAISIVPIALGLIGSFITERIVAGVLLILASIFSLPIIFGFYGISFTLLLIAGILALVRK